MNVRTIFIHLRMKSTSLLAYTTFMLWTRKEPKRTDYWLNTQLREGIKKPDNDNHINGV